jgi:hypothetical protein
MMCHPYNASFGWRNFLIIAWIMSCISCNNVNPDPSPKAENPNLPAGESLQVSATIRISNQDLNKSFNADGKREVEATPLLPFPVTDYSE